MKTKVAKKSKKNKPLFNKTPLNKIVAEVVLRFCENLAELGMPQDYEDGCDMWFRYLSEEDQTKIGEKIVSIIEREAGIKLI